MSQPLLWNSDHIYYLTTIKKIMYIIICCLELFLNCFICFPPQIYTHRIVLGNIYSMNIGL